MTGQPVGVVAGSDEQGGGGIGCDAGSLEQVGYAAADGVSHLLAKVTDLVLKGQDAVGQAAQHGDGGCVDPVPGLGWELGAGSDKSDAAYGLSRSAWSPRCDLLIICPTTSFTLSTGRGSRMGEYYVVCNLDKRELISPRGFDHGSKPGDLINNAAGGALAGLVELLLVGGSIRATEARRGHLQGRWAGDRVALVGDYFDGELGATNWTQDEWCERDSGRDGWVNITEHVARALGVHPDSEYIGLSVLHPDGSATSLSQSEA